MGCRIQPLRAELADVSTDTIEELKENGIVVICCEYFPNVLGLCRKIENVLISSGLFELLVLSCVDVLRTSLG